MHDAAILAYFADDTTRTYQLVQWLPVLELLQEQHPVAVVARDPAAAELLAAHTSLPVELAVSFPELTELYAAVDPKVVLYCNNSMLNFQSLLHGRALHVHINHGESDKQSMASNNAKAYDRVFVAGEAAVQRHVAGLLELDTSRLVRTGRPQLDLRLEPLLEPTDRRTVLYAPTWEGDAEYNDYTSVDTIGPDVVRAILAVPDVRLVYKPHPKVVTSTTPGVRDGHRAILALLDEAVRREPDAGHVAILLGDILAVMPDCDAMVTDVSSVGLDWLYLRTERPIFITDRHHDAERLRQEVPVSRCADVLDDVDVSALTELLTARLAHDEHHLARVAMRHHYFDDLAVGDSTVRFLDAVAELVARRDALLGESAPGAAITA
ncbi:CDP-glycerol--glycerophosphate glycerophosphotransferase [Nocardioides sp. zg-579]|uniref:CDP-glycerol--glycerophosphate glycerophosphotransferase n=1 Tax=Nocardioides marmotae TaxID=2663857 RepID=A0A6I3J192_9ACTN|nr:CDP-glycerol glycerophosphotransferase family protein [Nocardioides marmotae]MCR6031132.1 CDP-glycerol--glycerophosphate glycerophosphotransferase [Gordonia jinghuaiqii]MTB94771.1 CDP-glycerol--glycerophosphate glycerophosphotransferase [Nocardioides marmotae]QKE01233.1 CDP-glycerol--glycerophosphate glycerophosphotransferase [Nocardioides marmotae]